MPELADTAFPDFDNPPVVETVLSVQFERLAAMRAVHFGLFWQRVRDDFPKTEERPALPPILEQAKEPLSPPVQLRMEPQETIPPQRLWLINATGTELMQIQTDRFIKNWRKTDENQDYPHYEPVIKPAFQRDFAKLQAFVDDEKFGSLKVNQCEVTYVNHIVAGEGWNSWDEFDKVFTCWNQPALPYPGKAEGISFQTRFPIIGPGNEWIGRLHVEVQPALRLPDARPMFVMNLTARGMTGRDFDFFDIGRQWVVNSFMKLTTDHMHNIWRKK